MRSFKYLTELEDNGEVVQDTYLTFPGHGKERGEKKENISAKAVSMAAGETFSNGLASLAYRTCGIQVGDNDRLWLKAIG